MKNVKNLGKSCFVVRKEWVNVATKFIGCGLHSFNYIERHIYNSIF